MWKDEQLVIKIIPMRMIVLHPVVAEVSCLKDKIRIIYSAA